MILTTLYHTLILLVLYKISLNYYMFIKFNIRKLFSSKQIINNKVAYLKKDYKIKLIKYKIKSVKCYTIFHLI